MQKTIVFDFDGVIHSYTSGWEGIDKISDAPVDGIKEVIDELRKLGYMVCIVSTRCAQPEGIEAITKWLNKYEITVDKVSKEKPPALVYIDDRAITFDGDCTNLLKAILNFKSWTERR